MQHQFHFNRKFYIDKKTGYWISTTHPRIRAHTWVWINSKGDIPKGHHIHHIDGDKSNNCIENLECLVVKEHVGKHLTEERKRKKQELCEIIRPLTKKWHASKEGIEWHSKHALEQCFGKWEPKQYPCQQCSNKYFTSKRSPSRFCSNTCKSKWRRKSKIDDIEKICDQCSKIFNCNKYAKSRFCSIKCARLSYWDKKHKETPQ